MAFNPRREMSRKKVSTTIYITPEQADRLKLLHERTKVPIAVYIREGIDLMLKHYEHVFPGQMSLEAASALSLAPPAVAASAAPHDGRPPAHAPPVTLRRLRRGLRAPIRRRQRSPGASTRPGVEALGQFGGDPQAPPLRRRQRLTEAPVARLAISR